MVKITKEEFEILQPKCSCPDHEEIPWKERYKYYGVPEYIHNHRKKKESIVTKEEFEKLKPRCNCPCGLLLVWKEWYKKYGIPKYKQGHNSQQIRIEKALEKHKNIKEEFEKLQPRCGCPCNGLIPWNDQYIYKHFPFFIYGHNRKGTKQTEETKYKISISSKGRIAWNKGMKMSEEFCIKNSNAQKGKKLSEETKRKQSETLKGEKSYLWKGGISFEPYCKEFNNQTKKINRNNHNHRCFLCDKNENDNITKNGKVRKLSVHHIDGDKEQGCNGKKWFLVPLCMKCHAKTIRSPEKYVKLIQLLLNLYYIKDVWSWFI